jgi:hypothetical protein
MKYDATKDAGAVADASILADDARAEAAESQLAIVTKERDELRDSDPVNEWLAERDKRIAAESKLSAREAEVSRLREALAQRISEKCRAALAAPVADKDDG